MSLSEQETEELIKRIKNRPPLTIDEEVGANDTSRADQDNAGWTGHFGPTPPEEQKDEIKH
jgi:hypothetical protein